MENKKTEREAMLSLFERHLNAINELDPAKQKRLFEETYAPDFEFVDPFFSVRGHEKTAEMYKGIHERFPGSKFKVLGKIDVHHGVARLHWELGGPGNAAHTGYDFIIVKDGKISGVYVFIDGFDYEN